jgi:hypothetical protein
MGLDKLSVTLYDLLGYLLPGYILLLACSVAEATFWGSSLFALSHINRHLVLSAIVAYFLGHASHAIGSLIKTKKFRWFNSRSYYRLNSEIDERITQVLQETYGLKLEADKKLSNIDKYLLADSYIIASGGSVEREILLAREGFFKATVISFSILGLIVLSTSFAPVSKVQVQPGVFVLPSILGVVSLTTLLLFLAWLFYRRFSFFNCVKNNYVLLTFLALRSGKAKEHNV